MSSLTFLYISIDSRRKILKFIDGKNGHFLNRIYDVYLNLNSKLPKNS